MCRQNIACQVIFCILESLWYQRLSKQNATSMNQKHPESLNIKESDDGFEFASRWYKPAMAWSLVIFDIFWISFSVYWLKTAQFIVFYFLGLIFLAVGIGLIWYIVCLFINKTTTTLTSQDFAIKHSPIPFPTYKNTRLKRSDIEQVYIKEEFSYGKERIKTLIGYSLNVLSPKGVSSKVLDFDEYETGILLKKKIEKYMHITPQAVEGEYIKYNS